MMIRRKAFESLGGFDERFFLYWEDADFCFRLKGAGWSVVYNPGERVTHLTGRSSVKAHRRSLLAFHRSAYLYYATHVVPSPWHPARWFARVALTARAWWRMR